MTAHTVIIICALGVIALLALVCCILPRLHDESGDDARDYCADEAWADRFHGGIE
jgi:hypothetical protein